jgi:hypothetical protein
MPVHHVPALPAGEQQASHRDQRQQETFRHDRRSAFAVTGLPVVELDQDYDYVAAGMPPGVVEAADALRGLRGFMRRSPELTLAVL